MLSSVAATPGRPALVQTVGAVADPLRGIVGNGMNVLTVAGEVAAAPGGTPRKKITLARPPVAIASWSTRARVALSSPVTASNALSGIPCFEQRQVEEPRPKSRHSECGGQGTSMACCRYGSQAKEPRDKGRRPAGSCRRPNMQCATTSRIASRTRSGAGSSSPVRTRASSFPSRRPAASKKCPEPQAGSKTRIESNAFSRSRGLAARRSRMIGSRADWISSPTSGGGV